MLPVPYQTLVPPPIPPQDTVLFNDTVMHNIRYGRIDATDEEVVAAAKVWLNPHPVYFIGMRESPHSVLLTIPLKVAHIHESIANKFKKGYLTKVGKWDGTVSGMGQ